MDDLMSSLDKRDKAVPSCKAMLAVNNLEYKEKHREQTCVILKQSKTGIVQSALPNRHPKFAGQFRVRGGRH